MPCNCACRALDKEELSLWFLFERLSTSFSKDSSDFLSTLSASVELVRTLGSVEGGIVCLGPLRTLRLSAAEVAAHLAWGRRQDKEPHPLLRLEKMLVVCPLLACPCLPCVRFFLRHLAGTKKKERESHHWPQVNNRRAVSAMLQAVWNPSTACGTFLCSTHCRSISKCTGDCNISSEFRKLSGERVGCLSFLGIQLE